MKTVLVPVQVEVPVGVCAKCGKEKPFVVAAKANPDGHVHFACRPPFRPLVLAGLGVLICEACEKTVDGAIGALGIEFPKRLAPS